MMNDEYTLKKYVDEVVQCLVRFSYNYSYIQAREKVDDDYYFVKESYEKNISAYDTAIEIGYCCG